MQFKKGSFEVDTVIYPVAIKVIFLHLHFKYKNVTRNMPRFPENFHFNFDMFSTIQGSVMRFGTAVGIR